MFNKLAVPRKMAGDLAIALEKEPGNLTKISEIIAEGVRTYKENDALLPDPRPECFSDSKIKTFQEYNDWAEGEIKALGMVYTVCLETGEKCSAYNREIKNAFRQVLYPLKQVRLQLEQRRNERKSWLYTVINGGSLSPGGFIGTFDKEYAGAGYLERSHEKKSRAGG